jgi:hypothetical protein
MKYIGITFEWKLPWNEHMKNTSKKTTTRISELYQPLGYHTSFTPINKF